MTSPVWHPFTQHGLEGGFPLVARAEGALLHGADGRSWIDAISSWWVTTHGHCHPRIMQARERFVAWPLLTQELDVMASHLA